MAGLRVIGEFRPKAPKPYILHKQISKIIRLHRLRCATRDARCWGVSRLIGFSYLSFPMRPLFQRTRRALGRASSVESDMRWFVRRRNPTPPRDRTTHWRSCDAALKRCAAFLIRCAATPAGGEQILRCNLDPMPRIDHHARPEMIAAASLHHDNRRRLICHEPSKPRTCQLHSEFQLARHRRAMRLQRGFCQAPDHRIIHLPLLCLLWFRHLHFW